MEALIVIDMQKGSFRDTVRHDADGVVARINGVAEDFRQRGDAVVFIQHDGSREGEFVPGTDDWKLLPSLIVRPGDAVIAKRYNDAFIETALEDYLARAGIRTLYIAGCATDFCVNATVQSAVRKSYDVVILRDCHTTADRPMLEAAEVVALFNWMWSELLPVHGTISVMSAEEVVRGAEARPAPMEAPLG